MARSVTGSSGKLIRGRGFIVLKRVLRDIIVLALREWIGTKKSNKGKIFLDLTMATL